MRRPRRLDRIHGFGIDRVAAAAGDDPDVLHLENLDTDLAPPPEAVAATRDAAGRDDMGHSRQRSLGVTSRVACVRGGLMVFASCHLNSDNARTPPPMARAVPAYGNRMVTDFVTERALRMVDERTTQGPPRPLAQRRTCQARCLASRR